MEKLWSKDYILVCIATFLMCFSFFILVPSLPFYLKDNFGIGQTLIGFILSCYVASILAVRPLSGYIADRFPRKLIYALTYGCFAIVFLGYLNFTGSVYSFIVLRIIHGIAFGLLTTSANTIVIDIMPASRRGEGLGYFGIMNNLAMAIGPMVGLFIISQMDYTTLFETSLISASLGFVIAISVKSPYHPTCRDKKFTFSIDRFILVKGIPAAITLLFLAIPNAMTTSYMAMYAKSVGIEINSGIFFTIMAAGLILSRIISGKQVDRGKITETITQGIIIVMIGVTLEALLASATSPVCALTVFVISAFMLGFGFGTIFPAFNTLFINLAPNSLRATANATYLTGWDAGIGCGMLLGGILIESSFVLCFTAGAILVLISLLLFTKIVSVHFQKNRLR